MIEIKHNVLDKETYLYLRERVGWVRLSDMQAQKAISGCIFNVCAYLDGNPVGMGRIVGDGAVISYIQDLVVIPEAQGMGIGSMVLEALKDYVRRITEENTRMMLCLMCAKGRERFYMKHGFMERPNEKLGPGMIIYIEG